MPGNKLLNLVKKYWGKHPDNYKKINADGSKRQIWIFQMDADKYELLVGVEFFDTNLNKRFIDFSNYFAHKNLPVTTIINYSADYSCYLCSYVGPDNLAKILATATPAQKMTHYQNILPIMDKFYSTGLELLQTIYQQRVFDSQQIQTDIHYFQQQFVNNLDFNKFFDKQVQTAINWLVEQLIKINKAGFVYRDFQARNITYYQDQYFFIDFQDGLLGADGYDLASLLFAGASHLDFQQISLLLKYYCQSKQKSDVNKYLSDFFLLALLRKLHSLATYCKHGLLNKNPIFQNKLLTIIQQILFITEHIDHKQKLQPLTNFFDICQPYLLEIEKRPT